MRVAVNVSHDHTAVTLDQSNVTIVLVGIEERWADPTLEKTRRNVSSEQNLEKKLSNLHAVRHFM
jgi:hypothetical protein